MKRILIGSIVLLTACRHQNPEGTYVHSGKNEYTISDDTLIVQDGIVTDKVGYNRIRAGKLKPRQFSTREFRLNEVGTPVIIFKDDGLMIDTNFYKKLD